MGKQKKGSFSRFLALYIIVPKEVFRDAKMCQIDLFLAGSSSWTALRLRELTTLPKLSSRLARETTLPYFPPHLETKASRHWRLHRFDHRTPSDVARGALVLFPPGKESWEKLYTSQRNFCLTFVCVKMNTIQYNEKFALKN